MKDIQTIASVVALGILGGAISYIPAQAGNCVQTGAIPFGLASDTVQWSVHLAAGTDCIQGLRYGGMLVDTVEIISPPRGGRVTLQGPSFRYRPDSGFSGTDSFSIAISGTRRRMPGRSVIDVAVTVQ